MIQLPKDILEFHEFVQVKRLDKMYGIYIRDPKTFRQGDVLQTTHCLELLLEGTLETHYGGQVQHLKPHQIQFRKRGNYQLLPSADYKSLLLFMENEFVIAFLKEHVVHYNKQDPEDNLAPFLFSSSEFIYQNVQHLISHITRPGNYASCNVKLTTHQVLLQILAMDTSKRFVTFLKNLVQDHKIDLSYFMEVNFLQQLSLKDLAKLSGRSVSTFKREFMEQFHSTPVKWVVNRRLEYANYLLEHTEENISSIAYDCRFESPSHFSKLYKKKFGNTPREKKKAQATETKAISVDY